MGRVWAAVACVVAGVAVLAGPGWALLTAGVLVYVAPVPDRVRVVVRDAARYVADGWRWLAGSRRAVAVASMPPALVLIPVGVYVAAGGGAALVTGGVLLAGLSFLVGWNHE